MKYLFSLFFLTLITVYHACAQRDFRGSDVPISMVHGNFGGIPGDTPYYSLGAYAERFLKKTASDKGIEPFIKGGIGARGTENYVDIFLVGQIGVFMSNLWWFDAMDKHHLEFYGGVLLQDRPWSIPPISAGMGYRYQKPNGLRLFRVGISFPEGAYIGLGFLIHNNGVRGEW